MIRRSGILMAAGVTLVATVLISSAPASASAGAASPARRASVSSPAARPVTTRGTGITAVVVKSWGQCSSAGLVWDDLNANWSSYGSVPISIDYANPDLCGTSFTLAALEASGANVVILDDPAGGQQQFSADEVSALQTYASEGHNLLATYLTFGYPTSGIDNSALAPLFGLKQQAGWTGGDVESSATYSLRPKKAKALLHLIPNPYVSTGFDYSQRPGDGTWSKNTLNNDTKATKIAGINGDKSAAIIAFQGSGYYAVYIATMPEYGGGTSDQQFIYNAIIHG